MGDLADQQDAIAAEGIGLAAISADSLDESLALADRLGVSFPLLADPDAAVARRYGVKQAGETLALPATFVIGVDGTIVWSHVGETKPDRPAIDRVREHARGSA